MNTLPKRPSASHRFGGSWTDQKLNVVRRYLDGYAQAMKHQSFRLLYIDGFAGTGEREKPKSRPNPFSFGLWGSTGELDKVTKGSAKLALEVEPPFDRYILIDENRRHTAALEELKQQYPKRNISVLNEDANRAIRHLCRSENWRFQRAVLFLDPYGMQVEWKTMEAVAKTCAMDVWVLFPNGMGLNRMLTKDGNIPETWQKTLDRFLGCKEWRDVFYSEFRMRSLFDDVITTHKVKNARTPDFEKFFLDRLRTIFAGVAPNTVRLMNKGHVLYSLCFAVGNDRGEKIALKIAKAAMKSAS